jgi:hypothetical protein
VKEGIQGMVKNLPGRVFSSRDVIAFISFAAEVCGTHWPEQQPQQEHSNTVNYDR